MNGYELMSHLRHDPATRRIPILVVTSRAGAKHRDRAMKEGAAAFLTKPVQEEQLLAVVEELMNSAERQRRPAPVLDLVQP
jgi:chemosensory pili system protein ChpA (sensor histidine kinase/response regulator)